jgi:hypothetical protein
MNKNKSQVLAPFLHEWREGWVVTELAECGERRLRILRCLSRLSKMLLCNHLIYKTLLLTYSCR